ncbi:hypothetical protein CkaCkLH20_10199 [Colletotrichum karsti]|uniref:Uncharacterized protein n=1 Tax=Colletotrichum karsti TaxID=1095194 RepID=A0A9P6LHB1_9PEZI|nr:uncharacterized protein CkaCkLH20_10199 [Colletotrichum karsti]KAF9872372.1 hypothetical protein CkaCkLH20_10199 [Colletotrichum karsti]
MYGYLELEIRQYDAGAMPPEIGSIIVFFKNIKGLQREILDNDATRAELQVLNPKAKAKTSLSSLKLTFNTTRAGYEVISTNMGWLRRMNRKAGEDVELLRKMIEDANPASLVPTSPLKLELLIAVRNDDDRERLEEFCEQLKKSIKCDRSKKTSKWSLAPWFDGVEGDHPLSMSDVPRLGPGFPETAPQPALARFVDIEHYWVTQAVGAVNEAVSASDTRAKASHVLLEARVFNHARFSISVDQFFILIIWDKTAVDSCTEDSLMPARGKSCEIRINMPGKSSCQGSTQRSSWMPARRFDHSMAHVPDGAFVYLVDFPDTARKGGKKQIDIPFMTITGNTRAFEDLMDDPSQQNLKVQVRPRGFNQTISLEVDALQRLSSPSSFEAIYPLAARAFDYLLNFTIHPDTPTVNLLEELPGLASMDSLRGRTCLPGGHLEWLKASMGNHQRLLGSLKSLAAGMGFFSHDRETDIDSLILCFIAAATFGTSKEKPEEKAEEQAEEPKARKKTKRRVVKSQEPTLEQVPSLFVSSTNRDVDDFAQKADDFFKEHDFGDTPGILRISIKDATVASSSVKEGMPNVSLVSATSQAVQDGDVENMDTTDHFIAHLKLGKIEIEGRVFGRSLYGRLTIHEASYRYYLINTSKFPRIKELARKLRTETELDKAESLEFRGLIKQVYAAMMRNFKGVVCTVLITAAHPCVRNFDPSIVFVGDAGQMRELSSLIPIAYYVPDAWIFFGCLDGRTPYSAHEAQNTGNPFLDQLKVSLFERAQAEKFPEDFLCISTPEQKFLELTKTEGAVKEADIAAVFDELKPVSPDQLIGSWEGGSFDTGHPAHQQLRSFKWAGKDFRSVDDVDPIMVYGEDGKRSWFSEYGHARIREVKFRDVVTAAMCYDKFPIIDAFRRVDDDTVLGAMDNKDLKEAGTYYFYLKRRPGSKA